MSISRVALAIAILGVLPSIPASCLVEAPFLVRLLQVNVLCVLIPATFYLAFGLIRGQLPDDSRRGHGPESACSPTDPERQVD